VSRKISTSVKVQLYNSLVLAVSITLWSRDLANNKINDQEVGRSTSQVAQEDLTHFVERLDNQRESQRTRSAGNIGRHHQREETKVGGTCHEDELTENCQTSYQLETDRWQKRSRPTSYRLAAKSRS